MSSDNPALHSQATQRYASALLDLAIEKNQQNETGQALDKLAGLVNLHPSLETALRSPVVTITEKKLVFMDLCDKQRAPELIRRFLAIVASAGRAGDISAIADSYTKKLAERRGAIDILVRTAANPNKKQKSSINEKLSGCIENETNIVYETNPNLIGGMQILIGSRLIDTSLRNGLETMSRALKGI